MFSRHHLSQLCCRDQRERGGFTIIEMIVSLAVIGLLMALLLPAIQAAREAARRAECLNNLKTIGQGMSSFESSQGHFPPSGDKSAHAEMLNWLGYPEIFNQIEPGSSPWPFLPEVLPDWTEEQIPVFQCPSDAGSRGTNYVACTGAWYGATDDDPRRAGAFGSLTGVPARDIRDGLSQTVGFSESLVSDDDEQTFDRHRDGWWSGLIQTYPPPLSSEQIAAACDALVGSPTDFYPRVGKFWHCRGYGVSNYNHMRGPNSTTPHCFGPAYEPDPQDFTAPASGVFSARSQHPQCVNIVLMDGSARAVSESIDLAVWRALASIGGAETVGGLD